MSLIEVERPNLKGILDKRNARAQLPHGRHEDFATKLQLLIEKLGEQMAQRAELDLLIRTKLGRLGYECLRSQKSVT